MKPFRVPLFLKSIRVSVAPSNVPTYPAAPTTCKGLVGEFVPIPTRLFVASITNVLLSKFRPLGVLTALELMVNASPDASPIVTPPFAAKAEETVTAPVESAIDIAAVPSFAFMLVTSMFVTSSAPDS